MVSLKIPEIYTKALQIVPSVPSDQSLSILHIILSYYNKLINSSNYGELVVRIPKNSFASVVSKTAGNKLGFEEGKKIRKYDKNYSIAGIAITKNKYRYLLPLRLS